MITFNSKIKNKWIEKRDKVRKEYKKIKIFKRVLQILQFCQSIIQKLCQNKYNNLSESNAIRKNQLKKRKLPSNKDNFCFRTTKTSKKFSRKSNTLY